MKINSCKVISFFEKYTHLDKDKILEIFVDLMENLFYSLDNTLQKDKITEFMHQITDQLSNIEENTKVFEKSIENVQELLSSRIEKTLSTQRDFLILNIRDTIKANQGDVKDSLERAIKQSQSTIEDKLDVITKHDILSNLFKKELDNVHDKFRTDIQNQYEKEENYEKTLDKVQNLIHSNYLQLNDTLKVRMETFFASNQNVNRSIYSDILSKLENNIQAVDDVNYYLQGQNNSSMKGKQGEKRMESILSTIFPTAEIKDTSGKTSCGDFIVTRRNYKNILIDTKDYKRVVPLEEIDKIIRDIELNKCHGILVSQNSGIANKNDMEIGIHNQHIIVYIHNAGYDASKILIAANVIDYLDPILKTQVWNGEHTLSSDMLRTINEEYRSLARQKETLIEHIKTSQSNIIGEISKIKLTCLASFLDSKFQNTDTTEHVCTCGWSGKNKQSLSAHRRYCKTTNIEIKSEIAEN
jgi:hypothetical protein